MRTNLQTVETGINNIVVLPDSHTAQPASGSNLSQTQPELWLSEPGIVKELTEWYSTPKFDEPTQIVVAKLWWPKRWLTKARRETLKGIIEYNNRYLKLVGGRAKLRISEGAAVAIYRNPWRLITLGHQRLGIWAKQQGCSFSFLELQ